MADKKTHYLVDEIFKRTFTVMLIAMASGMICVVVDSALTGRFLGSEAMAAMGLVTPATTIMMALMSLVSTGIGQLCTRSMGKADIEQVNRIFSTLVICTAVLCFFTGIIVFFCAPVIAQGLGSKAGSEVISLAEQYLRGFAFNLVPLGIAININSVMVLDNDQKRCITYAFTVFGVDVILDLLNVYFIHLGMLGMALATSLSSVAGLVVLLFHFRQEGHLIHFSLNTTDFSCLGEAVFIGMANTINQLSTTFRTFSLNNILLIVSGNTALAALAVASSVFALLISLFSSLQSVTSTVMNLSYGEEDINSIERTLYVSLRVGYRIGAVVFGVLFIFAGMVSHIFLKGSNGEVLDQATRFVRCYSIQNFLALISYSMGGSFMGTKNVKLNYLLCVLRDAILPVACTASGGFLFGIRGVEAGLIISGVLTMVTSILIPSIKNRRIPQSLNGLLILPESFTPREGEMFEASMSTAEDVSEVSGKVQEYCLARGEDKKTALFVSLFIEEMAGNTVRHGFEKKKTGLIELKLIMRKDKSVIRLRDNGISFDPVKWLEINKQNNTESNIGIRMIVGLSKEIDYLPSMGLNNIVVTL